MNTKTFKSKSISIKVTATKDFALKCVTKKFSWLLGAQ